MLQARLLDGEEGNRPSSLSFARGASLAKQPALPSAAAPAPPARRGTGACVLWLFFLQVLAVLLFSILSFVLPNHVSYLTGDNAAIHVAAVHSVMFFVVSIMWLAIRAFDFSRAPRHFPLNRNLAELNAIITILANGILLLCLGVEDWVKQEAAHYDFSVLSVVQVLGLAELALVGLSGAGCLWRSVQYLRDPTYVGSAAAAQSSSGSARALPAAPETPRPGVQGGTITQRLQEVRRAAAQRQRRGKRAPGSLPLPHPSPPCLLLPPRHSPPLPPLQRVRQLEDKEAELLRQMARLAAELAQASALSSIEEDAEGSSSGSGGGGAGEASQLARVVQSLTLQQAAAVAAAREGEERMQSLERLVEYYEGELRRANEGTKALQERLRERKRDNEKLAELLDQEREHAKQAQAVIEDYRDRLASPGGGGGPSAGVGAGALVPGQSSRSSMSLAAAVASLEGNSAAGPLGGAGAGGAAATPGAYLGGARSASRASFAAMVTPAPPSGLGRTLSRSGASALLPSTTPAPPAPNFNAASP